MVLDDRNLKAEQKRFEADVSSVLFTFERAREWADLTSCLNRLHKSLSRAPSQLTDIPFSDVVAKRLGQCLNPTLPAGVHGKCLDIYHTIFTRIGTNGLAHDLGLWTHGLFPIFQDAATHIRPQFLDLIDQFYIPLKDRLKPCLTGLLVSLLPGIDVAGGEVHNRVMSTFHTISDTCVGLPEFMFALWIVLHRTSRVRLPALHVLVAFLPDENLSDLAPEDLSIYLPDTPHDLVMRAFERLLSDNELLVRRQLFDFLVPNLPLDCHYLRSRDRKVELLRASFRVLAVGEWSLARRFLQWITGQADMLDGIDLAFFRMYVRDEFCEAFQRELEVAASRTKEELLLPFKIFRVIQSEAEELIPLVLQRLAVPLWMYAAMTSEPNRRAVLESVRHILTANVSSLSSVWNALDQHIEDALKVSPVGCEVIEALRLAMTFWDDQYGDIITLGPPATRYVDDTEQVKGGNYSAEGSSTDIARNSVHWGLLDLQRITAQALRTQIAALKEAEKDLQLFFELSAFSLDCLQRRPSWASRSCSEPLKDAVCLYWNHITDHMGLFSQYESLPTADRACSMLSDTLVSFLSIDASDYGESDGVQGGALASTSPVLQGCETLAQYCVSQMHSAQEPNWHAVRTLIALWRAHGELRHRYAHPSSEHHLIYGQLIAGAWQHVLGPTGATDAMARFSTRCDAATLLLSLDELERKETGSNGETMVQLLIGELSNPTYETRIIGFRKFVVLWQYSHSHNPHRQVCPGAMRLVLDCLDAPEPSLRYVCRSWLAVACPKYLPHVVDPLFEELVLPQHHSSYWTFDTARTVYVLSRLSALLRVEPRAMLQAMYSHRVVESLLRAHWNAHDLQISCVRDDDNASHKDDPCSGHWGYDEARSVVDYVDLSCVTALRFIDVPMEEADFGDGVALRVRSAATEFLLSLLEATNGSNSLSTCRVDTYRLLAPPLLRILKTALAQQDVAFQIQALDVVRPILPYLCVSHLQGEASSDSAVAHQASIVPCEDVALGDATADLVAQGDAWKAMQLRQLPQVLGGASHTLLDVVDVILSLVRSTPEVRPDESLSASLASLIDFVLLVIRHLPESHVDYAQFHTQVLLSFVKHLSVEATEKAFLGLWHVLRGLIQYIHVLVDPIQGYATALKPASSTQGAWTSTLFWNWLGGSPGESDVSLPTPTKSKRSVLKTHVINVVAAVALIIAHVDGPYNNTIVPVSRIQEGATDGRRGSSTSQVSSSLDRARTAAIGDPLTDGHVSAPHLRTQTTGLLLSLLARCPEETVIALVVLLFMERIAGPMKNLITLFIQADAVGPATLRLIISITVRILFVSSVDHVPSPQPATLLDGLPNSFVARESELLGFLSLVLESTPDDVVRQDVQVVWDDLFELLQCVVSNSKEPMSFLWMITLIEQIDARYPSRETTLIGGTVETKRVRRQLQELTRAVALLAAQQWRVQHAAGFDCFPPCPFPATTFLKSIFPSHSCAVDAGGATCADVVHRRCPRSGPLAGTVCPVVLLAHLALACLIRLNVHVNSTRRRTAVSVLMVTALVEDYWRTIIIAATRSVIPETLEYRYLGFLFLSTLPHTLLPACTTPCKRIVYEFIHAPAFGGSHTTGHIFSQIAPVASEGICVFQGLDRRSFRSLVSIVRVAADAEGDALLSLGDTLTACRSTGVFSTKETELFRRARELKRLAFMLLACPKNFFVSHLAAIGARVLESLRVDGQGQPQSNVARQVIIQAFLCFRVLCLRTSSHLFSPFWPIVLTELIRIFSLPLIPEHYSLILAVLKVVDLAILLDLPDFHLYQWVFIADASTTVPFTTSQEQADDCTTTSFASLCSRLAGKEEDEWLQRSEDNDVVYPTQEQGARNYQRQPLVVEDRVSSVEELQCIAARLNQSAVRESFKGQEVDEELVIRSIENDLLDCPIELMDWAPGYILPTSVRAMQ